MGIQIDPSLACVWRDTRTIQVGVDPPLAVVRVESVAEERFLTALRSRTSAKAVPALAAQCGCDQKTAATILAALAPALVEDEQRGLRSVEVHGVCRVSALIATLLADDGWTVVRTPEQGAHEDAPPEVDLAVLVSHHVADPAVRAAWTIRGAPHLPVVIADGRSRLGPLILPDVGPCLQCVELARADDDPAWPVIASQLWGRAPVRVSRRQSMRIASTACDMIDDAMRDDAERGRQILMPLRGADAMITTLSEHPRCSCRALPGNDSHAEPPPGPSPAETR